MRGRASTRVRAGALRQATFSSMLIVGALPAPSPSGSIFGVLGPFLLFFDDPEPPDFELDSLLVELAPASTAFSTGLKPSSSASCNGFGLSESFKPASESVRPVRPGSGAPVPVSPGAGSAYVFFFSFH
jgi:hypothetical protein